MDVSRISKFLPFGGTFGLSDSASEPGEPARRGEQRADRKRGPSEPEGRVVSAGTREDRAEISSAGQLFRKLQEVVRRIRSEPDRIQDARGDAINRARIRVGEGFYDKPDVLNKTADAILASGDLKPQNTDPDEPDPAE